MKSIRHYLSLALLTCGLLMPSLAPAAVVVAGGATKYVPNLYLVGIQSAGTYTNATTTATDVTGTPMVIPATLKRYDLQYIRVCWSADVTKATSTTGSIGVYLNGALQTDSVRFAASAAGAKATIGGCYTQLRNSSAAQTVSLQGVSGDTATFTVNNAMIEVWVIQLGG